MNPNEPPVASPCKRQCHLVAGGCPACGRSLPEIQNWLFYTPERRADIMARALPGRLALRACLEPVVRGGTRLGPTHAAAVLDHLMALSTEDRRARFGHAVGDEALARWVAALDWGGHWLWAVIDNTQVLGLAHLTPPVTDLAWELALSVVPAQRGSGMGRHLLTTAKKVAQSLAPNGTLMMRGSAQNPALQRLAREGRMLMNDGEISVVFDLG